MGLSPEDAIRLRARALINEVQTVAEWEGPPFDLTALASFCGFQVEITDGFSPQQDAFIVPGVIAINRRKPTVRQRYSIAHEIVHTLFPDYEAVLRSAGKLWREERMTTPTDIAELELEHLCQVGAAELLLPQFAFAPRLQADGLSLDTVMALSTSFGASPEATVRRATELTAECALTVFVQPWDAETGRFTRDYAPFSELRVTRSYASPASAHWMLPVGSTVPKPSVISKAWKRASYPKLGVDIHIACERWPAIQAGAAEIGELECHAMVLPFRACAPGEVLALLRLP